MPHVHYRPGGAVYDPDCDCEDPGTWPPPDSPAAIASLIREEYGESAGAGLPETSFARRRGVGLVAAIRHAGASARRVPLRAAARMAHRALAAATALLAALARGAVRRIEYLAVIAAVAVGAWAAWDVDPTAGRAVLAAGLLFLGGGIGRLIRELRGR